MRIPRPPIEAAIAALRRRARGLDRVALEAEITATTDRLVGSCMMFVAKPELERARARLYSLLSDDRELQLAFAELREKARAT